MMTLPTWQEVWHRGFAPLLSGDELEALRSALATDDVRLTQGSTTTPPPLMCLSDWVCEGGCVLGYCGVLRSGGFGVATVGEAEECFARLCFEADQLLGQPAACRTFLNFVDDTPRDRMRAELLAEVEQTLDGRKAVAA